MSLPEPYFEVPEGDNPPDCHYVDYLHSKIGEGAYPDLVYMLRSNEALWGERGVTWNSRYLRRQSGTRVRFCFDTAERLMLFKLSANV